MVAPAYPLLAALVSPPIALAARRPQHPAEGVAALEPQLDAPVDIGLRRTVAPIGAPASPLAPTVCSPRFRPPASAHARAHARTPDGAWASSPMTAPSVRRAACDAVAAAHASSVLAGSLDALSLGDSRFNAQAPPALPAAHAVFQPPRQGATFARVQKIDAREGATNAHHADGAHRSRSIMLRNLAPGIDDESIRRMLEAYGPLRELGAQHRARGGKGSVAAAFFDLRHARNAVLKLDGAFHFGRRIEVRFQPPGPPTGPSSPRQARGKGGASSPDAGARHRANGSPGSSPPKAVNQGTLVVFNLDPGTTAEEIRELFGSIGDVKEIRGTPNKKHHKFVEFYDIRDAQRALETLNKTELGGKKIKIEISRPGGRINAGRNNANSGGSSGGTAAGSGAGLLDGGFSLMPPASSHMYAPGQTPPSTVLRGQGRVVQQNQASQHQGRTYPQNASQSPFSSSFPGLYSTNEVAQRRAPGHGAVTQNVNPGVGNTYTSHHGPLFPAAALGGPASPPGAYYNNVHNVQNRHRTPPLRSLGLSEGVGPSGSLDSFQFEGSTRDIDPQPGRSFDFAERELEMFQQRQMGATSPNSMFNGPRHHAWHSMPPQVRRGMDPRCHLDVTGVTGNTNMFRGPPRSAGAQYANADMARIMGHGPGSEGYEYLSQSREDLGEYDSPAFSPLSSSRSHDLATFAGMLGESRSMDPVRSGASASLDMYGVDIGKDRSMYRNGNGSGTVGSFPSLPGSSLASSLPLDRRFNGNDTVEKQQRESSFANGNVGNRNNHHDNGARRSSPSANRSHGNGNSHGPSSFGGNPKFTLNIARVMSGEDTRTALMIRNIPNKYNQRMLLLALDDNHRGHFDFIYLPIDFKNKCNVGYAFINFTRTEYIPPFYDKFHGRKWLRFNSEKVCEITYARIQGKSNLIGHFQNSSLMNEDPKCRPVVFDTNGKQEEFPVGPNVRTKRGPSVREAANRAEHSPPFSPLKSRGRGN